MNWLQQYCYFPCKLETLQRENGSWFGVKKINGKKIDDIQKTI